MRRMSPGPQARPGQPRVASQRSAAQPAGADATEAGERSFAPRNAELFLASMADDGSCTAVPPALKVILGRQGASGLWEEPGRDTLDVTVEALAALLHYNVRASHPVHGAQVKKAIVALLEAVAAADDDVAPVALALGLAWLLSTGRRTRRAIEDLAKRRPGLESLTTAFESERKARSHVDRAWAARRAVASSTVP